MLQTSGAISLSEIGIEYHEIEPYILSDFYGYEGLPIEGEISLSDFYGKSYRTINLFIPDKSYFIYEGKSMSINFTTLLYGVYEVEAPDNIFVVVNVSEPINGDVEFKNTYATFTSTGEIGEEAGFSATLLDGDGFLTTMDVVITVIAEPAPSPELDNNCIIDEMIGMNTILEQEPSLICKILSE